MVELRYQDISLRGLSVRVADVGHGPDLLLVHGFLVSHREWEPVLPYLADHFRCIVPDLPGCGASAKRGPLDYPYTRESFAEVLAELLRAMGVSRTNLVGHSMGGGVAITLAADRPELVDRLVLIDSACYPFSVPLKGRLPIVPGLGPLVFKHLYRRSVFRDYFAKEVFSGHPTMNRDRVDEYYREFSSREGRACAYAMYKTAVLDVNGIAAKIPRVQADTLVIWGDEDRIFPVGLAHRLCRELPSARLEVVPFSGHAPNEEHPETTASLIRAHVDRTVAGDSDGSVL